MLADEVVKQCGTASGKSGKVQIIQGELTAAASVDQVGAMLDVFGKDKNIKVVSNQAANWDANTALESGVTSARLAGFAAWGSGITSLAGFAGALRPQAPDGRRPMPAARR